MARRGGFRASLSPFGGGKLNLDDAYRVAEPEAPTAPAPPAPAPAATPPTTRPKVAPKRPIVKKPAKPIVTRPAKAVVKRPVLRKPIAKRIPPKPKVVGQLRGSKAARPRLVAPNRAPKGLLRGSKAARPKPKPPRPRVGAQRRFAVYG